MISVLLCHWKRWRHMGRCLSSFMPERLQSSTSVKLEANIESHIVEGDHIVVPDSQLMNAGPYEMVWRRRAKSYRSSFQFAGSELWFMTVAPQRLRFTAC